MSEIAERIMALLRPLTPEEREATWAAVRYNDEFCVECGMDRVPPGRECYCLRDD